MVIGQVRSQKESIIFFRKGWPDNSPVQSSNPYSGLSNEFDILIYMYTQCYIHIAHFSNGWARMLDGYSYFPNANTWVQSRPYRSSAKEWALLSGVQERGRQEWWRRLEVSGRVEESRGERSNSFWIYDQGTGGRSQTAGPGHSWEESQATHLLEISVPEKGLSLIHLLGILW